MEYLIIFISAIFVNNIVLTQFLGICPFLGVSKKISTSLGMGAAVIFVITLATIVTWLIQHYLLNPFNLGFLQTIAFILVIAALVQMVEIILKKISPSLYAALGVFLPLITTNCAILGAALLNITNELNFIGSVIYGFSAGIGFTLAIVLFASVRQRLILSDCPKSFEGFPIALITSALLAMSFMGFQGLKIW